MDIPLNSDQPPRKSLQAPIPGVSGVKHEEALSGKPRHNFNIYTPYKTEEVRQYLMSNNDSNEYDQNI